MYPIRLDGERAVLRELVSDDERPLAEIIRIDRGARWDPSPLPRWLRERIAASVAPERTDYALAITTQHSGELVGTARLRIEAPADRRAALWMLLIPEQQEQGAGVEALALLLHLGFARLGLHRIAARCDPQDLVARRVLDKGGMRLEGHLRHERRVAGSWRDELLYAIVEDEWNDGPGLQAAQSPEAWPFGDRTTPGLDTGHTRLPRRTR